MQIKKEKKYLVFSSEKDNDFNDLFTSFIEKAADYDSDNIILDITNQDLTIEELSQFSEFSSKKMDLGTSFVILYKVVDLDELPDELVIVPTFQEAIDMIEMDEMTRSLDF